MKAIKIYLIVVTVLLITAMGFGVYVWYKVQKFNTEIGVTEQKLPTVVVPNTTSEPTVTSSSSTQNTAPVTNAIPVKEPIILKKKDLSGTQQKIAESLGFSQDTLEITPAMISCAENAIGKDRLDAIIKGGAPSAIESLKLVPCFKA